LTTFCLRTGAPGFSAAFVVFVAGASRPAAKLTPVILYGAGSGGGLKGFGRPTTCDVFSAESLDCVSQTNEKTGEHGPHNQKV